MLFIASALFASVAAFADIDDARQAELRYLLQQDCGSCHGLTLKGGLGPALLPDDLAGKPPELLVTTILDGRENTAMPAWRGILSYEEAAWLTEQLLIGDAVRSHH
jgi:cytochrome c55X